MDVYSHLEDSESEDADIPDTISRDSRLRRIFDLVSVELRAGHGEDGKSIVILDDIATLEWLGFSVLELTRFSRALRALCVKEGATLLIRHHVLNRSEPDTLFRHLLQLCSYHVEVRPLSSGRSGAVSGEVSEELFLTDSYPIEMNSGVAAMSSYGSCGEQTSLSLDHTFSCVAISTNGQRCYFFQQGHE
ncbi:hypothetical protein JVU11DRAFT_2844 [Chiua virens]|nr:hypothetical protein JVU11DRAFT_2844 [Chiua virens]